HFGGLGGWELNELSPLPTLNTSAGTNVSVALPNGVSVNYCSVSNAGTTFSSVVPNPFSQTQQFDPLLAPYDINGPELPINIAAHPKEIALVWSSAVWGQNCASSNLAEITLPLRSGMSLPRLLQLQWDGAQYAWKDITTVVDPAAGKIKGAVSADYLGIL